MLKYVPIVIKYVPAFLTQDNEAGTLDQFYMIIHTPPSRVRGVVQSLPERIVVPILVNKVMRFKLVSSDTYVPKGRYKVEYYKKGSSLLLNKEEWVVPSRPQVAKTKVTLPPMVPQPLPSNFYDLIQPIQYLQISLDNNTMTWTGLNEEELEILYQPGVTLDQLIQSPHH